jgi:hypothetical protein
MATADLSPIEESESLQDVWGPFSSADIERIGQAKPDIIISNGIIRYSNGHREVL